MDKQKLFRLLANGLSADEVEKASAHWRKAHAEAVEAIWTKLQLVMLKAKIPAAERSAFVNEVEKAYRERLLEYGYVILHVEHLNQLAAMRGQLMLIEQTVGSVLKEIARLREMGEAIE